LERRRTHQQTTESRALSNREGRWANTVEDVALMVKSYPFTQDKPVRQSTKIGFAQPFLRSTSDSISAGGWLDTIEARLQKR
jgi:hypothetical protein